MLNSSLQKPTPDEQLQHTGQFPYKPPTPSPLSFPHSSFAYASRHFDCANEHNTRLPTPNTRSLLLYDEKFMIWRSLYCPSETQRKACPSEGQQCLPDACLISAFINWNVLDFEHAEYSSAICKTDRVLGLEECNTWKVKVCILLDVDGKYQCSRLRLNHKKNIQKLLVERHILNKDNSLVFIFSAMFCLFFTGGTLLSKCATARSTLLSCWNKLNKKTIDL